MELEDTARPRAYFYVIAPLALVALLWVGLTLTDRWGFAAAKWPVAGGVALLLALGRWLAVRPRT